jgi:hypothetical protein
MFLDKSIDIINQSVMFTTIGAALLGVKNVVGGKKSEPAQSEPVQEEVK